MNRTKRRTMVRSNSSRRSMLFGSIDGKLSRTFSLSSCESDVDEDRDRLEGAIVEAFEDEGTIAVPTQHILPPALSTHTSRSIVTPRAIPDLRVPLEKFHVPREASAFFMETMIRRDETKTRYIMYQQSTTEANPIFCAQKYPPSDGGQILIKSINPNDYKQGDTDKDTLYASSYGDDNSTSILGSLVKKKTKSNHKNKNLYTATTTTTYELIFHQSAPTSTAITTTAATAAASSTSFSQQASNPKKPPPLVVATMEYEQVSKARYLVEGGRPRCAKIAILGKDSGAETKEPHQRANGQKVLDFGGRGLETSSKNTQLIRCPSTSSCSSSSTSMGGDKDNGQGKHEEEACCLQMVKWKDQEFNLDFGPPFDAFHAFAFALAQFDF